MTNTGLYFMCFMATFVAIYDEQKMIYAHPLEKREIEHYPTKYDNIDIKPIVTSKRLMRNYANCLLEKGPCTPEGNELRTYLPDALTTKCVKCSDRQRELFGTVIGYLVEVYPDLFEELLQKYDKDGKFRAAYEGTEEDDDEDEE